MGYDTDHYTFTEGTAPDIINGYDDEELVITIGG
jgi:hypothetical protein